MPKNVTDASFDADVLRSEKPVLVDFWAAWCGPCGKLAPVLDELDQEIGDRVTIAKVDIEGNPQTPTKFGVRGIPALILFKGGQPIGMRAGAMPKKDLAAWLEGLL